MEGVQYTVYKLPIATRSFSAVPSRGPGYEASAKLERTMRTLSDD